MDPKWTMTFHERMRNFQAGHTPLEDELAVSIKIRITSGCFHREHSPHAYAQIDRALSKLSMNEPRFVFEEHESGPEILIFLAATTAGLSLAKSVVDLITTIIKARSEGIVKGDHPQDPLELIIRRVEKDKEVEEDLVLRIGHKDLINSKEIAKAIAESLQKISSKKNHKSI